MKSAPIPGGASKFASRDAVVYLPPAYLLPDRPKLPVLVLISGQPGSPEDWIVGGRVDVTMDRFAAQHGGLAPVVVVPDPNGQLGGNTLCMDSKIAAADTFMSVDVPAWIAANLDVDSDRHHWAVGGFSFGGTCALQLALRHPDIYPTFLDLSGEREPALSIDRRVTVGQSFGVGNVEKFDAQTPLRMLAKNRYPTSFGFFAAGALDSTYMANMSDISTAASKSGMKVQTFLVPDKVHSWRVGLLGLAAGIEATSARLGLSR